MNGSTEFDAVLDLCRHRHRRVVLAALAEQQRPIPVNDLARAVAERDRPTAPTKVADGTVTQVEHSLHHVHLPKLEDAGAVAYDADRRLVEPTATFDWKSPHLSTILDADPVLSTPVTV